MRTAKRRDLPEKVCPVRGRPFRWRKKWREDREPVVYRSDRRRSAAKTSRKAEPG